MWAKIVPPTIKRWWEHIETPSGHNRTIAICALFTLVTAVVYTVFAGKQWREMRSAGEQTDKIIRAAQQVESDLKVANAQNLDALQKTLAQSQTAMQNSNAQSEKVLEATIAQARLDQRAFISFGTSLQVNPIVNQGSGDVMEWEVRPIVKNSGETPTRNARIHMNWLPRADVLPAEFGFQDLESGNSPNAPFMLGPKESITGPVATIPTSILTEVHDKSLHLYFYGWSTYRDIFPKDPPHVSMFCIELTDARLPVGIFSWQVCPHHNCADEECKGERYGNPTKIWPD